jgi:hypothetical protein
LKNVLLSFFFPDTGAYTTTTVMHLPRAIAKRASRTRDEAGTKRTREGSTEACTNKPTP